MTQKREELMRMMKDLKVLLFQAFPFILFPFLDRSSKF